MPEITVVGENGLLGTWGWEISIYLFLGGLVAGLLIFSGVMRFMRLKNFTRSLLVADLAGLPLLGVGMLCLLIDLSNKINVWRLYTTFQLQSAMSWGAWILLVTMLILALRFVSRIPSPSPRRFLGLNIFPAPPASEEEAAERAKHKPSAAVSIVERVWTLGNKIAQWVLRHDRAIALIGLLFGIGLGFYTGILLSTIPARPLWNTAILGPLFLVSGLASAGAFLCLFLPDEEHVRLVPFSILMCGIEFMLLLAFVINLNSSNQAVQRAGALLLSGAFGLAFWGLIIVLGLVVPAVLELFELMHIRIKLIPSRLPPVLKLIGGLALRFVIVYAGMLSFL